MKPSDALLRAMDQLAAALSDDPNVCALFLVSDLDLTWNEMAHSFDDVKKLEATLEHVLKRVRSGEHERNRGKLPV